MNRRKFFAFLPLAPVAAIAAVEEAKATEGAPHENSVMLTLNGTVKPSGECMHLHNKIGFITPQYDPDKKVSMAVGDDGSLWIKNSNQEWKRVVTE